MFVAALNEVSRTQIGLLKENKNGSIEHYGEWLASRMICTINSPDQTWTMEYYKTANGSPELRIDRQGSPLTVVTAAESSAGAPGIAGRAPVFQATQTVGDRIAGVTIADSSRQLAATSLVSGNNVIWLDPELSDNDRTMMVAASYGLILESWLTE